MRGVWWPSTPVLADAQQVPGSAETLWLVFQGRVGHPYLVERIAPPQAFVYVACLNLIHLNALQDFIADVADLNPEYCVGSIVSDLLQMDSLDSQLIALRTLHLVATSVPCDSAAAFESDGLAPRRSTTLTASSTSAYNSSNKQLVQVQ